MFKTREGTFDSDDSEDECLEIWYDTPETPETLETPDLNDQTSLQSIEIRNDCSIQNDEDTDLHNQLWTKIHFIMHAMVNYFI